MGSGPGVAGESGMHVHPFVPLRSAVMAPRASIVAIVAFDEIAVGAADSALAMASFAAVCCADPVPAATTLANPAMTSLCNFKNVIETLLCLQGRSRVLADWRRRGHGLARA
jgi:hypothetical protein